MHRSTLRLRVLAPLALATLTLGMPAAAVAETTPTPSPTTTASQSPTPPASSTPTATATPSTTTPVPEATPTSTPAPATTTPAPSSSPSVTPERGGVVKGGDSKDLGLRAVAGPVTSTEPALVAAGFLERELAVDGNHHLRLSGYPDYGLTLDAILALDAAGAAQTEATKSFAYVADHIGEYLGFAWADTELYAGATAKTLLVALAQKADPTAVGGVDLVASLTSLEQPNGRFTDRTQWQDYSNMIGQSLAVMALDRAQEPVSSASTDFITQWQCTDGGFALYFTAPCESDPDATAYAVQALIAARGVSDLSAQHGLDYLTERQQGDGGVGGAGPTAATNSNSTGLAGQAFSAGGRVAQARAAQSYIRSLQFGCASPASLRGAIAYNAEAKASATVPTDQERRATPQAILALAATPLFAVSATGADATAPELACASPTPTPTATPSATPTSPSSPSGTATPTVTTGPGTAAPTTTAPVAAAPVGDDAGTPSEGPGLAYTGATLGLPLLLATLLLLAGAGAILVSRRRGAHQ